MVSFKNYTQLVRFLREQKIKIATAESCTGGLISKLITDVPGSSGVFIGGVVSYSNAMKTHWLKVSPETLMRDGAVSETVVAEMLTGIVRETNATLAIAVSGIAGPGGGTPEKPVGTVFIGVKFNANAMVRRYQFPGTRHKIRLMAADKALHMAAEILSQ
ncbi:MAG: CinA family protein [Candidatus Zhuqueibacterota bacterium]